MKQPKPESGDRSSPGLATIAHTRTSPALTFAIKVRGAKNVVPASIRAFVDRIYCPVHMLGTKRLHNCVVSIWKNARTLPGFFYSSRNLELTARCKSLGARINVRATPWFLTSFQTSSSGLISGEYGREKEQSEAVFHLVHEAMTPTWPCVRAIRRRRERSFFG